MTREPEFARQPSDMTLRRMRNEIINHVREKTRSLSWYSGDQLWQLLDMLNAQYCRDTHVQLSRRIAIMSENQTRCSGDDRVQSEFFGWVTGGDDSLYDSKLWNHDRIHTQALDEEWTRDVCSRISKAVYELRTPEEKLVELSTVGCGGSPSSRLRLEP